MFVVYLLVCIMIYRQWTMGEGYIATVHTKNEPDKFYSFHSNQWRPACQYYFQAERIEHCIWFIIVTVLTEAYLAPPVGALRWT